MPFFLSFFSFHEYNFFTRALSAVNPWYPPIVRFVILVIMLINAPIIKKVPATALRLDLTVVMI
jgi:hypothetical protein